ncbi:hypothetical protein [Tenacibaculum maritimum]|uniref:Lipoprotein n=7 Tax=Tenacibaculum maritimum TaxID=107401 RepID=A0A2H1ECR6_9FLAO|nr:hypothetical protein [Tenacibaculum maritimum]MCD9564302.1 hypothetical protein [Tenacibaculum maritimum]MCD9567140.1 hypothetical protein [Tenacibaculum maritimum]MCD9580324.1 hypothetical protein [Tenacibaculum maritimum]MCD9598089.1 hypothetical protein [Tenacibaculum maritimum]MCD9614989.1 hypothetical protein [Tenacibaculum maritimum]
MKNNFIFLFSCFLALLFSCKEKKSEKNIAKKQKNDSLFIPKYAIAKPNYQSIFPKKINKKLIGDYKSTQLKLKKGFLEDPLDDNSDVYGHPDYDYGTLVTWNTPKYPREEIYFNAKKINKEYLFFYEKSKLICVFEGKYNDDAIFEGDSLFFNNDKIFLWKNTNNLFVTDSIFLDAKSKYIMRLDKEIRKIKNSGFTEYIDRYIYKKDSLSSFVIGNLK